MNVSMRRAARILAAAGAALALAACSKGLSGVYGERDGVHLEFHSNGKVEITLLGMTQEGTYVVEDGKVKVTNGTQGTLVMAIDDKGCLNGGFLLGKLCKV